MIQRPRGAADLEHTGSGAITENNWSRGCKAIVQEVWPLIGGHATIESQPAILHGHKARGSAAGEAAEGLSACAFFHQVQGCCLLFTPARR